MSEHTKGEIVEFLKAADRDLGSGKYKASQVMEDYAKAITIGKQLSKQRDDLLAACKQLAEIFPEDDVSSLTTADFANRGLRVLAAVFVAKAAIDKVQPSKQSVQPIKSGTNR